MQSNNTLTTPTIDVNDYSVELFHIYCDVTIDDEQRKLSIPMYQIQQWAEHDGYLNEVDDSFNPSCGHIQSSNEVDFDIFLETEFDFEKMHELVSYLLNTGKI